MNFRWVLTYRADDLIKYNTNDRSDWINEELKYKDLDWYVNLTVSELLKIIIKEFLPRRCEGYVEMNVQYSSGFKKYQNEIPSCLSNHARINVEDTLKKI